MKINFTVDINEEERRMIHRFIRGGTAKDSVPAGYDDARHYLQNYWRDFALDINDFVGLLSAELRGEEV